MQISKVINVILWLFLYYFLWNILPSTFNLIMYVPFGKSDMTMGFRHQFQNMGPFSENRLIIIKKLLLENCQKEANCFTHFFFMINVFLLDN